MHLTLISGIPSFSRTSILAYYSRMVALSWFIYAFDTMLSLTYYSSVLISSFNFLIWCSFAFDSSSIHSFSFQALFASSFKSSFDVSRALISWFKVSIYFCLSAMSWSNFDETEDCFWEALSFSLSCSKSSFRIL